VVVVGGAVVVVGAVGAPATSGGRLELQDVSSATTAKKTATRRTP
jgi:hypothetical protein